MVSTHFHSEGAMKKEIVMKKASVIVLLLLPVIVLSQESLIIDRLAEFETYMEKVMADWNTPGAGVGVVYRDKLVYARGFGYRDYGRKLPVTPKTLFQIASNTKLFTTILAGFLVTDGMLNWDNPIKMDVPEIEFYDDELNRNVTLRDMLGHKTGISRHDMIWYQSDFTRKELFERLKYLEPSIPLRQDFLYNNLMYVGVGYCIELKTGNSWERNITERIFAPLEMNASLFSIAEMQKTSDYGVPYNEQRDTTLLYQIPLKEDGAAVGPAGSIISNIDDLSHWVIALLNDGRYMGNQVIPPAVLKETLKPGIAFRNTDLEEKGYSEKLNTVYCLGRFSAVYKGHVLTYHGGDLPGFHSQIAILPEDSIGVITFVIGDQSYPLRNIMLYNIIDRLLDLGITDWHGRWIADRDAGKAISRTGRAKAGFDRIPETHPSHDLRSYTGIFGDKAYGTFEITEKADSLFFCFRKTTLPLSHYHYDRFDTPNDEDFGKWSINFFTDPEGEINSAILSIDEGQVTFHRQPDPSLFRPEVLTEFTGSYDLAGTLIDVNLIREEHLEIKMPGSPAFELIPFKKDLFRLKKFDDQRVEFIRTGGVVTGLNLKDPSGIYSLTKVEPDK
jgi:CubicO group peptidase (beta-lactamase class C family)